MYIWKLAFLRNTTYNTEQHGWALSLFAHTDTTSLNRECTIYEPLHYDHLPNYHGPLPDYSRYNWAAELAEGKTAFLGGNMGSCTTSQ